MNNEFGNKFINNLGDRVKFLLLNTLSADKAEKVKEEFAFKNYEYILEIIHDELDSLYCDDEFYIYDLLYDLLEKDDTDGIKVLLLTNEKIFQLIELAEIVQLYMQIEDSTIIDFDYIDEFLEKEKDILAVNNINQNLIDSFAFDLLQLKKKRFSSVESVSSVFHMPVVGAEDVHEVLLNHLQILINGNNITSEDIAYALDKNDASYLMGKFALLKKLRTLYTSFKDGEFKFISSLDRYIDVRTRKKDSE